MSFSALVLTAGRSQRMGSHKAWLRFGGQTFLERIARACVEGGADRIVIVVGSKDRDSELVSSRDVKKILGPLMKQGKITITEGDPDGFPIDSIRAGLRAVPSGHHLLLWPVDHPFASPELVHQLKGVLRGAPDRLVLPIVSGRRTHPILMGADVARELFHDIADLGAHRVVHRDSSRVIEIPWSDPRMGCNINTPEDAATLGVTVQL